MFGDLWFEDYVKIGDNIWFAAGNYNGLYKFNIMNKAVKRIATFPEEPISKNWAFKRVKLWDEQLVFMPAYANSVYLFDMGTENFERIDIFGEKELSEYQTKCKFQCFEIYENWLYLIGHEYPGIIKVNLINHKVEIIKNILGEVFAENIGAEKIYFGSEMVVEENIMFITCVSSNQVVMLDMDKDSFEVIEVGNCKNRYSGIHKVEDSYYLTICDNDNILRWERDKGICTEIEINFDIHFFDRKISETQNYIWVFSYVSNEVIRIDKRDYHIFKIPRRQPDDKMMLVFAEETQDGIYYVNMYDGEWHIMRENGTDENLHFSIKDPDKLDIMRQAVCEKQYKEWGVLPENGIATMELLFLKIFDNLRNTEKKEIYDNRGKMIYEAMGNGRN